MLYAYISSAIKEISVLNFVSHHPLHNDSTGGSKTVRRRPTCIYIYQSNPGLIYIYIYTSQTLVLIYIYILVKPRTNIYIYTSQTLVLIYIY